MTLSLPLNDFRWMTEEEVRAFDPTCISDLPGPGYILEVDLSYPKELHMAHSSFPLAPETLDITEDLLSPYSKEALKCIYGKTKHRAKKLTATFFPRKKYVVHGCNLKFYLEQGMVLDKIHRIITFYQEPFVAPYILYCTKMRKEAKTETERTFWKLIINALYGKLIEGMNKRMDCRFNRNKQQALRNVASPLYKGSIICDEDFSISFLKKKVLQMNKQQWSVGFSILELSKLVMQRLYYEVIQPRFGVKNCEVLMSDTDSFLLRVKECGGLDGAMERLQDVMDFSNFPPDHKFFTKDKEKELGYLKNEHPNKEIVSFVGLRSKTYAIQLAGGSEKIKSKGVPHRTKDMIPLSALEDCLVSQSKLSVIFKAIRSKDHQLQVIQSEKVAFSSFDDKRYLFCEIHSVPYGSIVIQRRGENLSCPFCDQMYWAYQEHFYGEPRRRRTPIVRHVEEEEESDDTEIIED